MEKLFTKNYKRDFMSIFKMWDNKHVLDSWLNSEDVDLAFQGLLGKDGYAVSFNNVSCAIKAIYKIIGVHNAKPKSAYLRFSRKNICNTINDVFDGDAVNESGIFNEFPMLQIKGNIAEKKTDIFFVNFPFGIIPANTAKVFDYLKDAGVMVIPIVSSLLAGQRVKGVPIGLCGRFGLYSFGKDDLIGFSDSCVVTCQNVIDAKMLIESRDGSYNAKGDKVGDGVFARIDHVAASIIADFVSGHDMEYVTFCKNKNAQLYTELLLSGGALKIGLSIAGHSSEVEPFVYYPVWHEKAEGIKRALEKQGIFCLSGFDMSFGPVEETWYKNMLCLPNYFGMMKLDVARVCNSLIGILK